MRNFNHALCYLSFVALAGAAEISFSDDNKLTGELMAMDENGSITLSTTYAEKPLKIHANKVQKIDFGNADDTAEAPSQSITLINGDTLPVIVKSLDDQELQVTSPILGDLRISRDKIDSLQNGLFAQKNIYRGPKELSEWQSTNDQIMTWKCEDSKLTAVGIGSIRKDLKLPENYSLKFKLNWKFNPNFKLNFSDPLTDENVAADRYNLQFGSAGIGIKRESTGNSRWSPIAEINRTPDTFENNEAVIEIRVNRKTGRLELYINNQLEGRYMDKNPPKGSGITFISYSRNESELSISEIEINEWHSGASSPRSEDRGDGKEDAVIGRNSERFGGKLISITEINQQKVYRFKSNFQEEPIDLPEAEVSTIYFSRSGNTKPQDPDGFQLALKGRGSLSVTKTIFSENSLKITHPLLGDLNIDRAGVLRMQRHSASKENTVPKP